MEIFFLPLDLISVLVVFLGGGSFLSIFRFIFYKIDKKKKRETNNSSSQDMKFRKKKEKKETVITHFEVNSTLLLLLGRTLSFCHFHCKLQKKKILCIKIRGDHFRFGSVFTFKKQPNRKAKKKEGPKSNRNRSKLTGFSSVWVWFFRSKTGKTYGYFSGFVMGF